MVPPGKLYEIATRKKNSGSCRGKLPSVQGKKPWCFHMTQMFVPFDKNGFIDPSIFSFQKIPQVLRLEKSCRLLLEQVVGDLCRLGPG